MQGNERVLHFASLAKYAAAFLRNTRLGNHGFQLEAQRPGASLQVCQNPTAMPFVISGSTRITISHAEPKGIEEENRDLACRRRHGLLLSDAPANRR